MTAESRVYNKGEFYYAGAERDDIFAIGTTSAASMKGDYAVARRRLGGRLAPRGKRGR